MLCALDRRHFLKQSSVALAGFGLASAGIPFAAGPAFAESTRDATDTAQGQEPLFKISLAEWSLNRALFSGQLTNLDFIRVTKQDYGIDAVEYVNQFFMDKAKDRKYLGEMNQRASDLGVKQVLIMVDNEGALGDADPAKRKQAVENHHKWVEAAKFLGCHSVRVNARSSGSYEEQMERAVDGLRRLTEFGEQHGINVIVENHGGLSSNGSWLAAVIKKVDHPRCGTLPDFGNFRVTATEQYDPYKGVAELMPYAKGVSAKAGRFDEKGNETTIDYFRMMKIVLDAGYRGYVGIESGGGQLGEPEAIRATKRLLERVREHFSRSA